MDRLRLRAFVLLFLAGLGVGRAAAAVPVPITIGSTAPALVQTSATTIAVANTGAAGDIVSGAGSVGRVIAPAANDAIAAGIGGSGAAANEAGIAAITDSVVAAGPAGELAVSMTEVAGADGIAAAAVACIASVVCAAGVAAAVGVGAAVHAYCHDGACRLDEGVPPQSSNWYTVSNHPEWNGPTAAAACAGFYSTLTGTGVPYGDPNSSGSCAIQDSKDGSVYPGPSVSGGVSQHCPNINGVQPAGWSDGSGGLICPSDGTNVNPDPNALIDATAKFIAANPDQGVAVVTGTLANGIPLTVTPYATTGPASQTLPATTTVTTAPDGTVTSAVATPQVSYQYSPSAIDVQTGTTTVTTVTNPDGTTSTSTAITGVVPNPNGQGTVVGSQPSTDPQPAPDLCALHPDVLACATLGEPPTDDVPKTTLNAPLYSAEVLGLPATCPAPIVVAGKTLTYDGICSGAMQAAPFVRVAGALVALLMVLAAVRSM